MNIREIAYAHYLPEKAKRRRANTVEGYRSALRLHVIPRWGDCEIQDIDPDELQDWVDSFDLPGAAEKAYKTLRQVIRWAIRKFRLRVWDPTQGIELPRKPAHEVQPLEAHEVKETLRAFWGHADEPTLLLSSCLGLRPGEAYALSWSDVDMRSGAVRVRSTLQEVGGLLYRYATKTPKSDRTLYLPAFALDRLKAIWRDRGKPKDRIIGARKPSQVARSIKRHCSRSGVRYVPMYHRRHTWATLAIEAGATLDAVALALGHSTITTAYEHYVMPRRRVLKSMQDAFASHVMAS